MKSNLRSWNMNDLDNLVKYGNNPKIARFMSDGFPAPYTPEKGKAFIEKAIRELPLRIFAIEVEGNAVGGIGIHPQPDIHRKNAEMGYWLAEPFWGNGFMTSSILTIVKYTFATFDINRIFARPFGTNGASQRVLEKAGFVLEAKFEKALYKNGEYLDELIYAIRKG